MKKILLILTIFLLFNVTDAAEVNMVQTKINNVPLQISTTSSQVLALIPLNTQLENLGTEGKYYKVTYNGQQGYVNTENMSRVGASSKEPVIETYYKNEQAQFGNTKAFSPTVISNTLYIDKKARINSLIYAPQNTTEDLPLIIYVHGRDEIGDNINRLANSNSLPKYLIEGRLSPNAIVLMPQSPGEAMFKVGTDIGAAFRCLINKVVETYNIDRDKISIVGFSMGCKPVYYTGGAYHDTFAAAVVIGGHRSAEPYISGLAKIPALKGFWGDRDASSNSPRGMMNAIKNKGGNGEFIVVPGATHGQTPGKVFLDYKLLDWLVRQSR